MLNLIINAMKRYLHLTAAGIVLTTGLLFQTICFSQNSKAVIKNYLTKLPPVNPEDNRNLRTYRMTAIYTNMDIYGNYTGKIRVTGDYTCGISGGYSKWNNVWVSEVKNVSDPFPQGKNQDFMEDFKYIPSSGMMTQEDFKSFPSAIENIYARNLIWDMLSFELFAWRYDDSLKISVPYSIPDIKGGFNMAEIGKYSHNNIELCWKGISEVNGELCAIIDFNADDNRLEIAVDPVKTKGTEQYWGSVWISLKTKSIEKGIMYGGTLQEIEVKGMKDKFLAKTIRDLTVERIR
jgi:hypothetical protein